MKSISVLLLLPLLGAMLLGIMIGGIDLLNPVTSQATAERYRVETAQLQAQLAHERQLQQFELQKRQMELQAYERRLQRNQQESWAGIPIHNAANYCWLDTFRCSDSDGRSIVPSVSSFQKRVRARKAFSRICCSVLAQSQRAASASA